MRVAIRGSQTATRVSGIVHNRRNSFADRNDSRRNHIPRAGTKGEP